MVAFRPEIAVKISSEGSDVERGPASDGTREARAAPDPVLK
jgi:hypothetical protein